MAKKNEKVMTCVSDKDKMMKLEGLPRHQDTFWKKDTSYSPSTVCAHQVLSERTCNKMSAFSNRERQILCIHGRMPVGILTLEQQVEMNHDYLQSVDQRLAKFLFLMNLRSSNNTLFYALLLKYPTIYWPVFEVSTSAHLIKKYSEFFRGHDCLFITITDRGHVLEVLSNFPRLELVRSICVTSGEETLSMGDQGVHGTAWVQYRRFLHVIYGGINPENYLPACLDVGTNNEELLRDPSYVGLRRKRCSEEEFAEFFEEFTLAVLRLFGPRTIIQIRDFKPRKALQLTELYRNRQCFFDIDTHVMGACGLASVLAAGKITQLPFKDNRFLFYGCTSFNIGMAKVCMSYLKRMGLNESEARQHIWFCDKNGLLVDGRCGQPIPDHMAEFQHYHEMVPTLVEAIETLKPNVLVGRCYEAGKFTKDVLRAMERSAEHPIIFAMSNPVELMECTADDAFVYTKGRCIFTAGAALKKLKYGNKWYQPGYCSTIYVLSGLMQGVLLSGMATVTDEVFLVTADRLAAMVWPTDLMMRNTFPPMRKAACVNLQIADAVISLAYRRRLATLWPEPKNYLDYITSKLYMPKYKPAVPEFHCQDTWPIIATAEAATYYKEKV